MALGVSPILVVILVVILIVILIVIVVGCLNVNERQNDKDYDDDCDEDCRSLYTRRAANPLLPSSHVLRPFLLALCKRERMACDSW